MYKFFAEPRTPYNYFTSLVLLFSTIPTGADVPPNWTSAPVMFFCHREEGKSFLGQKNALENLFPSSPPSQRTTGPALGLPSEWEPGVDVVVDVIRIHRGVALFVA